MIYKFKKGNKIHIKPENKGKFTEYCGGEVTNECIQKGKHSKDPAVRKRATFAANARKWQKGGHLFIGSGATSRWDTNGKSSFIDAKNFNEAFDLAVANNMPTFWYNGLEYNTKKETNPVREFNNRFVGAGRRDTKKDTWQHEVGPIGGPLSLVPVIKDTYVPEKEGVPTLELTNSPSMHLVEVDQGSWLKNLFLPRGFLRDKEVKR